MPSALKEVHYFPESQLRHPGQLLRAMFASLFSSRELAWSLAVRALSAKYRESLFGYLWAFLPPIVTTSTWVFLNSQRIVSTSETTIPYPVYVMIGTLLWEVFVDALNSPIRLTASSKGILTKINFPYEAILLASIYEVIFNFLIRLSLMVVIMIWFGVATPLTVLLAPLGILALMALGTMFGILLTPISMLFGDIRNGLTLVTSFWFFFTPIVYNPPSSGIGSTIVQFNPVSPLLITTREWITTGSATNLPGFLIVFAISLVLILFGWLAYRLAMPHIIARIGS